MRVGHSGRWLMVGLLLVASAAFGRHDFIGREGPAWMKPPQRATRSTRQIGQPTPTSATIRITTSTGDDRDPCWSADGTLIAFASNRAGSYDIYLCRTDGSNPDTGVANAPKLISGLSGNERYPAFSPGGTELAYVRDSAIYIRSLRTGIESLVSDQVGQPTGLRFSADGLRLAFSSRILPAEQAPDIWWISLDPSNRSLTQITADPAGAIAPAWFPSQSTILFASKRGGDYDIYQCPVPGPGAGPVADALITAVITGPGDQTDPAWVNPGGLPAAYTQGVLYADNEGGTKFDVKLANINGSLVAPVAVDNNQPNPANQVQPFANPIQSTSSSLCVYADDRTGTFQLYTTPVFDNSPPILSNGTAAKLPTVTPQQTFPGSSVKIQAWLYDTSSAVQEAYALIRRADRSVYQRNNVIATGTIASDGVLGSDGNVGVWVGCENIEYDQMYLDATTLADVDPRTMPLSVAAMTQFTQQHGLKLYDDGTHGDATAGDGVWTADFATPATGQDFYVDIVPIDTRGNIPVDTDLSVNNRTGGGANPLQLISSGFSKPFYALGYDHVAGFTTKTLDLTRKILFVSDYGAGQKYQAADFAGEQQASLTRYWSAALPVEHYYSNFVPPSDTNGDTSVDQSPDTPCFGTYVFGSGTPPPVSSVDNPYYPRSFPFPVTPANPQQTADAAMNERYGTTPFGGTYQSDTAVLWRILCRGPVDSTTLNAYTPLPLPQAGGAPIPSQDADRMVLWVTPYTGDLFVQPGTLIDPDVQSSLANFVNSGGRLFVSGQDVAWALTKNGTQANTFLTTTLGAQFVSDAAPEVTSEIAKGGDQRRFLSPATVNPGLEQQVFYALQLAPNTNPITHQLRAQYFTEHGSNGEADQPDVKVIRLNTGPAAANVGVNTSVSWAGEGAPNGWFLDDINPVSGAAATLTYRNAGATAMVRRLDATTGGRVVFASFPFEAIRSAFTYTANYGGITNNNVVHGHEDRVDLMTNISDYLRTGGFLGKVVGPDGATPVPGITIVARVGPQPDAQIMATTISLQDGTYLLRGLSTGNYNIDVDRTVVKEYVADHRPYEPVEGGQILQSSDLTIRLLRFETGTVTGTVTQTGGATVAGATVTATLQGTATNPLTYTTQSDNNGIYSLTLPQGTYTITATANNFGTATKTNINVVRGDTVTVDLVLTPAPGVLSGSITSNNQPVSGATIGVLQNGITVASTQANAGGAYTVNLPAGTYDLIVTAGGYSQATQTGLAITSGQTTTANVTLTPVPPGSLFGLITLSGSTNPIPNVTVNLLTGGTVVQSTVSSATATTKDGGTYNYRFDNIPAGTYDVQISAQGYSAATRTAVAVTSNQVTTGVDFQLQPLHTFIAGLSMTSTPFDYTTVAPDAKTLIDDGNTTGKVRLATWDPLGSKYVYYPTSPANTFQLGRGYFLKLDQNVPLTTQGVRAPTIGQGYDIQLLAGWNLIGHVYEFPVDLFSCHVEFQGQDLTLQDAASRGLVNAALYTLNFNQYQQVFRLDPYTGYWIRAFQNCVLRIPPTPLTGAAPAGRVARQAANPNQWQASIVATSAAGLAATAQFGVAPDAADVYDTHDRAAPPNPPIPGFVTVTFPHTAWGRFSDQYAGDVRGRQSNLRWDMEVQCDAPNQTIDLTWPSLGASVPASLRLVLVDLESGQQRSLRHVSSYRFQTGPQGGVHRFAILVTGQGSRPQISNITFGGGRGAGVSVSYTLSAPLTMNVEVRGVAGSLVRSIEHSQSRAEGTQTVPWDGRDQNGRPVPNGTYTLVLVGLTDAGEQVREVRTIQIRR